MTRPMDRDTVIALAREAGAMFDHMTWVERDLAPVFERFAALVEEHLKAEGYRHCAKGQRTTQWCGMLEQAVRIEREECAKVAETAEPYQCADLIRSRT